MSLIKAVKRYKEAVAELFKPIPGGGCLAEGSPLKSQEVFDAFMELNDAGAALSKIVADVEQVQADDPFKWRGYTINDVREQSKKMAASMQEQFAEALSGTNLTPTPATVATEAVVYMSELDYQRVMETGEAYRCHVTRERVLATDVALHAAPTIAAEKE